MESGRAQFYQLLGGGFVMENNVPGMLLSATAERLQ